MVVYKYHKKPWISGGWWWFVGDFLIQNHQQRCLGWMIWRNFKQTFQDFEKLPISQRQSRNSQTGHTVDGSNPTNQVVCLSYCLQGLYIPGGAGFLPSTVCSRNPYEKTPGVSNPLDFCVYDRFWWSLRTADVYVTVFVVLLSGWWKIGMCKV